MSPSRTSNGTRPIATTLWESRAALHRAQLAEAVNLAGPATQSALAGLAATGLTQQQALAQINGLVNQQSRGGADVAAGAHSHQVEPTDSPEPAGLAAKNSRRTGDISGDISGNWLAGKAA